MWAVGIIIAAFVLSLVVFGFAFGNPNYAVPIALVVIGIVGAIDFGRRRRQAREVQTLREGAKAEKVEFTERDRETLASE